MNNEKMPRTPFSTTLSGTAKDTQARLKNIFSGPKKRAPVLLVALTCVVCLLCGNLVACQVTEPVSSSQGDISQPDSTQQMPDTPDETEQPTPDASEDVRVAYVRVLEDLFYRSILPDGTDGTGSFHDMSENTFSLADVDGDGREELVLLTRPDIYAGFLGYILDYNNNALVIQHSGFPSFTFYSNGALAEDDSHAQGVWTDYFWPHSLYRYLPESDSYELAGHLSAWEKQVSDNNPDSLPPFPTEKDKSGAGILYYITPAEDLGQNFTGHSMETVDQSVYLEWLEPILGDARPLEMEYLSLTEENINRLK